MPAGGRPSRGGRLRQALSRILGAATHRRSASVGNGTHIGFLAATREAVDAFYAAALAAGAEDDGAPGLRPEYGAPYYGCFVRDPDGHKIEATFWDLALAGTEDR